MPFIFSKNHPNQTRTFIATWALLVLVWIVQMASHTAAHAQLLDLAQAPAGTGGREPAPNVIVSVDDSGSMGKSGIETLKQSLINTFSETNLPDDRIRLAWQSMNGCRGFTSILNKDCTTPNVMRRFSGAHRINFLNWVNTLKHGGGTPGHLMIRNAGEYLKATGLGVNSPWVFNPGIKQAPILSCRRSFHIYMTDGAYNSAWTGTGTQTDMSDDNGQRIFNGYQIAKLVDNRTLIIEGGNTDGSFAKTQLPDQRYYAGDKLWIKNSAYDLAQGSPIYADRWGADSFAQDASGNFVRKIDRLSTLSDLAFHYWAWDLQLAFPDNIRPTPQKQFPDEDFGTPGQPAVVSSFWNPRNDPATWQHMVNYIIGFNDAANWKGNPVWRDNTFSGLAPLIRREVEWPSPFCGLDQNDACDGYDFSGNDAFGYNSRANERKTELWHAALNSRGEFIPATNPNALQNAFQTILNNIIVQTANPVTSLSTNTSRLRGNGQVYIAGFDSEKWSGKVSAHAIDATTLAVTSTPTWEAHTVLDSPTNTQALPANRVVLTSTDGSSTVRFAWANLDTASQNLLRGTDTVAVAQLRVNYLLGERSSEGTATTSLRPRNSRLGDIVNSSLWVADKPQRLPFEHYQHKGFRSAQASRTTMLYVGANDGMLHAFNAVNGSEAFAYVPRGAYANLRSYTQPGYVHRYTVDGSPFTGDADLSLRKNSTATSANWRTVLVSGMGAGARGYFVLDVTTPTTNTSTMVLIDKTMPPSTTATRTADDDIGHIFSQPVVDQTDENLSAQIVKMNNGRWAVVMGNGYNSINQRPVLLVQYLDGDKALKTVVAGGAESAPSNGLSAPRLIDINSDGKMDIAYAGDLMGKLWKFNLSSTSDANWAVVGNTPLFEARNDNNDRQPITAAPLWMAPPQGGIQIAFGTGINVTTTDPTSTSAQSIYSLLDNGSYNFSGQDGITMGKAMAINGRTDLVRQTIGTEVSSSTTNTTGFFNTSKNDVNYSGPNAKRGWLMDLPIATQVVSTNNGTATQAVSERVLNHPMIYEGQKILIYSKVPSIGSTDVGETCNLTTSAEKPFVNVLNMFTGQPSQTPVFSTTDTSMNLSTASRVNFGLGDVMLMRTPSGMQLISPAGGTNCPSGQLCPSSRSLLSSSSLSGQTADWREVR